MAYSNLLCACGPENLQQIISQPTWKQIVIDNAHFQPSQIAVLDLIQEVL